ncbi:hypothetical protein AWB75_04672 [Caballeronia catudaia]|uniref:Uncharacterized protein n=1 Tax=Caballeronia catudaia TaxID=1777136 RepID=A0A158C868_9BURK|nr:hypothetical protein AWB75_04672 [Caballeronia catudaia]
MLSRPFERLFALRFEHEFVQGFARRWSQTPYVD